MVRRRVRARARVISPEEVADLTSEAWLNWSTSRRREFLQIALSKIEVLRDEPLKTPRQLIGDGETAEEFAQRREEYVTEVVSRRVRLTV